MPDNQISTAQTESKEEDSATATESTEEEMATEEEIEETQIQTGGGLGNLLTPEGIIMMGLAATLDVTGAIINVCGGDDCGILDIVGIVIICGWMLFRSQGKRFADTGQTKNFLKKFFTGKYSKFFGTSIIEIIPYAGAFPSWILVVFYELTDIKIPLLTSGTKQQGSPAPTANLDVQAPA